MEMEGQRVSGKSAFMMDKKHKTIQSGQILTHQPDLGRTEIFFELELELKQNYFSISNSNKNLELFELERRTRTPLENQFKKYSRTILFQVLKPNKKMA